MHAHARLKAKHAGRVLFYIFAVDVPSVRMTRQEYDEMRAHPKVSSSAKLPGILLVYVGMEMIPSESYLPPRLVRGAPGEIVDIELHENELPAEDGASIAAHGCVVLQFIPQCS